MMLYFCRAFLPFVVQVVQCAQVFRHFLILQVQLPVLFLQLLMRKSYLAIWIVLYAQRFRLYR
jgi:hypothetical protein